jgi:hypothetical protein
MKTASVHHNAVKTTRAQRLITAMKNVNVKDNTSKKAGV